MAFIASRKRKFEALNLIEILARNSLEVALHARGGLEHAVNLFFPLRPDGEVVVAPASGFAVAAEKDADQPAVTATTHELSDATGNISSKLGTQPTHCRPADHCEISCLGERLGEGQSVI